MHPTVVPARSVLAIATLIGAVACGGSGGPAPGPTPTTDHIVMSQPSATVQVNNQITLSATAIATDGTTQAATFTWATAAASIATVTQQGIVTGVAPGLVDITAKFGGKTGKTAVTVTQQGGVPTGPYTDVSISLVTWVTCARTNVGGARCWGAEQLRAARRRHHDGSRGTDAGDRSPELRAGGDRRIAELRRDRVE